MANSDISLEVVKNKEDFVNNRISRDLKKHNWLVEKLLQEKLIEKFDNVSSNTKTQKNSGKPKKKKNSNVSKPQNLKSKNAPENKKEELNVERCMKPPPSKLKEEDEEQSRNIYMDIAKIIYNKLLRNHKYTKRHTNHEKSKAKTKHEVKTTDKPSLGTIDDLFNNIKVFELPDKDKNDGCREINNLKTNKSDIISKTSKNKKKMNPKLNKSITKNRKPSRAADMNKKNDKNYIKSKFNKTKRKEKPKINTINITVGDSLTCHLQTLENIDNNVSRENGLPIHTVKEKLHNYGNDSVKNEALENPIRIYENCKKFTCDVLKDSTTEKKCKSYSVQAQTESVSIMTEKEREILDFLKLKKLDKVNLENVLQQSSPEPKPVLIKQEDTKKVSNAINNSAELLQAFLIFCDEYKKKTDELSERISVLFASIKEKETFEICNLAESIEKELENMTQESQSLNQVLDQMMESQQIPEAPNIISTEIQQEQNTVQNGYHNYNYQALPSQQQNRSSGSVQHQANINQQHNHNPQIQLQQQQQNLTLQHLASTGQQMLNGQPRTSLFQYLHSSQQTRIPQQIRVQQPNTNVQQSPQRLQNYQFRCQTSYPQNWPQVTPVNQINQYPYGKQNLEQQSAATISNFRPSYCPVTTSRQLPGQTWNSTPSSQIATYPMHNLQRPNVFLPQDENWRGNRTVF